MSHPQRSHPLLYKYVDGAHTNSLPPPNVIGRLSPKVLYTSPHTEITISYPIPSVPSHLLHRGATSIFFSSLTKQECAVRQKRQTTIQEEAELFCHSKAQSEHLKGNVSVHPSVYVEGRRPPEAIKPLYMNIFHDLFRAGPHGHKSPVAILWPIGRIDPSD